MEFRRKHCVFIGKTNVWTIGSTLFCYQSGEIKMMPSLDRVSNLLTSRMQSDSAVLVKLLQYSQYIILNIFFFIYTNIKIIYLVERTDYEIVFKIIALTWKNIFVLVN